MFRHQFARLLLIGALVIVGLCKPLALPGYASPQTNSQMTHVVKSGQSVWTIAQSYGVSVKDITVWNNLKDPNKLYLGQRLKIVSPSGYIASSGLSPTEVDLLARIIHAEARGEDFEGQVAVGAVVLNRLHHPQFPKTLQEVVYQPGAFTAITDNQIRLTPDEMSRRAAKEALKGNDPTGGAIFYYNPSIANDRWIKTRPVLKVIGNHIFSS